MAIAAPLPIIDAIVIHPISNSRPTRMNNGECGKNHTVQEYAPAPAGLLSRQPRDWSHVREPMSQYDDADHADYERREDGINVSLT
jgi:hypothetical protein